MFLDSNKWYWWFYELVEFCESVDHLKNGCINLQLVQIFIDRLYIGRWHCTLLKLPRMQWWRIYLPMQDMPEMQVWSLGQELAIHSSILAWRIPWTEEPGRLQSVRLQRVRYDLATEHTHTVLVCLHHFIMNYHDLSQQTSAPLG